MMFIGREDELQTIRDRLNDHSKAQLIILYGRRRIGKSALIRESVAGQKTVLYFEGIEGVGTRDQIDQFLDDLSRQTGRVRLNARNWREVFQGIEELTREGRWVLVFDEFPWMGSGRTRIVSELKLYWDRWSRNTKICLFLCGSLASFMTRHVVHSKALHNRKTLEMNLGPLRPREAAQFIEKRGIREKAQLYMSLGGVPKYLEQIDPRVSLAKNLNRQCFSANGFFLNEYETLFKEQFRSLKVYEAVVSALSKTPASLSELARILGVSKGGGLQEQVDNLARAGFVRAYVPVAIGSRRPSRTKKYKLADPFLLFFFRYMKDNLALIRRNRSGENLFHAIAGPTIDQYWGYAFERLCEDALDDILARLDLTLVDIVQMGTFFQQKRGQEDGLQIDWIICRRDSAWNLVEYKYSKNPSGMGVVNEMRRKVERLSVPDGISVEPVLVAASGVTEPVRKSGFFSKVIELTDVVG